MNIQSLSQLELLRTQGTFSYISEEEPAEDIEQNISNLEKHLAAAAPGADRKTKYGGYSTLEKTKKKISVANKGNVPHNKGQQRSEVEKKAISVGMNTKNERIIVEGLLEVGLGMTREQYDELIRNIKTLRQNLSCNPNDGKKKKELAAQVEKRDKIKAAGKAALASRHP